MYTLVDRIFSGIASNRKRLPPSSSSNRVNMGSWFSRNSTSNSRQTSSPVVHRSNSLKSDFIFETTIKRQTIVFIYLDLQSELTSDVIRSFRAINDDVQAYTNTSICLDFVRSIHDPIFFITSSIDQQLIEEFHSIPSIEAMFILNSETTIEGQYAKLYGIYTQFEELVTALRNTLDWFEQNQLEPFAFEQDGFFLWSQLWKEEFLKADKSISTSTKESLVRLGKSYYHENLLMHSSIDEFEQCYLKGDALKWCLSSPFPSRFIHRALRCPHFEHLQTCQFLLVHTSDQMKLSSRKSNCELYKGMKMNEEYLDRLDKHTGKLICTRDFLACGQSRKTALMNASHRTHRSDIIPVLFKITYDQSVPLGEIPRQDSSPLLIFDVYTVFRVKYVDRGEITTVKMEVSNGEGKKLAELYRAKHEGESVQTLFNRFLPPSKPPTRLPPLHRTLTTAITTQPSVDLSPNDIGLSVISEDDDESRAQELIEKGEIDQALEIYNRSRPRSARIFNTMALIYAEKKGDYEAAIEFYQRAMTMQEETGEDISSTLAQLGIIYQTCREFELALSYHSRALEIRKHMPHIDQTAVGSSLIGIANAYWGQQNLPEALKYAEEALALNESIERGNDMNIATNLAILANIYFNGGESDRALQLATRSLGLFEQSGSQDSLALATLYNNVGTMQAMEGLFTEARSSYSKALEICQKSLPVGHPKRVMMETNIERISALEENQQGPESQC